MVLQKSIAKETCLSHKREFPLDHEKNPWLFQKETWENSKGSSKGSLKEVPRVNALALIRYLFYLYPFYYLLPWVDACFVDALDYAKLVYNFTFQSLRLALNCDTDPMTMDCNSILMCKVSPRLMHLEATCLSPDFHDLCTTSVYYSCF